MGCNATKRSAKDRLGAIWVQFAPILTPGLRFLRREAACDLRVSLSSISSRPSKTFAEKARAIRTMLDP